jgi:hypothetical protein
VELVAGAPYSPADAQLETLEARVRELRGDLA